MLDHLSLSNALCMAMSRLMNQLKSCMVRPLSDRSHCVHPARLRVFIAVRSVFDFYGPLRGTAAIG